MSIKKTVFLIATTICAALPFQAQAGDLYTTNNTDFDSTSVTNNGACSTILGEVGISRAHTQNNRIPEGKVKFACMLNKHNCKADVYMTANCSGAKVATVLFDVDTGIKSVQMLDSGFGIDANGFIITISQVK